MGVPGQEVLFTAQRARATWWSNSLWEQRLPQGRGPRLAPTSPASCSYHLSPLDQSPVAPCTDPAWLVLLVNSFFIFFSPCPFSVSLSIFIFFFLFFYVGEFLMTIAPDLAFHWTLLPSLYFYSSKQILWERRWISRVWFEDDFETSAIQPYPGSVNQQHYQDDQEELVLTDGYEGLAFDHHDHHMKRGYFQFKHIWDVFPCFLSVHFCLKKNTGSTIVNVGPL